MAYDTLEQLLESGDADDLNKGDIVKAKQKIHSATQHEEQAQMDIEKSIEKLRDGLEALGIEPQPEPESVEAVVQEALAGPGADINRRVISSLLGLSDAVLW